MKKRIFGNRSRTKHVLAILLAVSMTVQQGGFVPASEGEVSIASEQPADAEAQARAQAEAEAKAKAEAEARAQAEAEAKAKAESEAKAKEEAEAKARAESEAKAKEEAEARAQAEAEAKAKAESEAKAKAESEAKAKAESEAKAKAESEAKAKAESEAKANAEAESRTESDAASVGSSESTEARPEETAPSAETENKDLPSETVPEAQSTETEKESELSSESTESNLQTETGSESESEQQTELLSETESESESESESETEKETEATKRVYQYSDGRVSVTATLAKASQVPDDAQFIVNKTGETDDTLYYDIYFNAPRKDENGNVTGWGEYEPESGSVSVSFRFNQNQLSEDLGAEQASDVTVVHVLDSGAQETLAANVSLSGSTDRVSFTTQSFSTYYFRVTGADGQVTTSTDYVNNQKYTWNNDGTGNYNADDAQRVIQKLATVSDYSVYTNELINNAHIEGNIAAGKFVTNEAGYVNALERINKGSELEGLKVVKNVVGGQDGTFRFQVVDRNNQPIEGLTFSITTKNGTGEFVVLGDGSQLTKAQQEKLLETLDLGPIYLQELDDAGHPIPNGNSYTTQQGGQSYTYEVTYATDDGAFQENSNQIASTALNNLIGEVSFLGAKDGQTEMTLMQHYFGPDGTLTYFDAAKIEKAEWGGSDNNSLVIQMKDGTKLIVQDLKNVTPAGPDGTKDPYYYIKTRENLTNSIANNLNSLKQGSVELANLKNGPASGDPNALNQEDKNAGALNVINLISQTGDLRKDFVEAGFNTNENGNDGFIKGLLEIFKDYSEMGVSEENDQYLLINIDCTGFTQYNLGQFFIDGYGPDSNNAFSKFSSHIIFNFVKKENGQFVPYDGEIVNTTVTGGIILAPAATVKQGDGIRGGIIADKVDRTNASGEIHKKTITSTSRSVTAAVQNATEYVQTYVHAQKQLERGTLKGADFSFRIEGINGAPLPPVTYVENNAAGDITFGPIRYDKAGSYQYRITEINSGHSWIQYDSQSITVTIPVTQGDDGKLHVGNPAYGGKSAFVNKYSAAGSTTFAGTKSIDCRELKEGDVFTFEIVENDNVIATATNDLTGKIAYPTLQYVYNDNRDDRRTHTYTVREKVENKDGITYSSQTYEVTVTVTDNGDGTLNVVKSENADALNFTNEYKATGSVTFAGTKTVKGWTTPGDIPVFDFEIKEGDTVIGTAKNAANGTITYPTIYYELSADKTDLGRHIYTVKETSQSTAGITVDTHIYTVVVDVTDNGDGTLNIKKSDNANKLNFVNTHGAAGEITFAGTKTLTGRALESDDVFSFKIEVQGEGQTWIATSDSTGKINYPTIRYTNADLEGAKEKKFTYTVSETTTNGNGITVDGTQYTVEVTVKDTDSGQLDVSATDIYQSLNFTNTYRASGTTTFSGKKTLEGRALKDLEFTFEVEEYKGALNQETATGRKWTVRNDASGKIAYPEIEYVKKHTNDAEDRYGCGEYKYVVKETSTNEKGVIVDTRTYNVYKKVIDNKHGGLVIAPNGGDPADALDFVNTYDAKGELTFQGTKTLEGRELKADDVFEFEIREGSRLVANVYNKGSKIEYPTLPYTLEDIGSHTYTITETGWKQADDSGSTSEDKPDNGVTFSKQRYTVTVTVSDNGDGTLKIEKAGDDPEKLDFINTYSAEGSGEIKVQKILEGRDWTDEDAFTFTISPDGANPDAEAVPGERSVTVTKADADQIRSFGAITFKKPGTYKYTVKEAKGEIGGITYDGTEHVVTIKVKDDEKGHLIADDCETVQTVQFTNTYSEEGRGEIKVQKVLKGREWTDADAFTFTIAAGAQNPDAAAVPAVNTVTVTKADADQTKSFGEIVFTKPGTYTYTVKETKGSLGGVTYDETEHTVTLTVESIGDGKLGAAQGDTLVKTETFTNTYAAAGTGEIRVKKNFMSPQWTADHRFEFTLEAGANTAGDGVETPMPEGNEHKAVITKDTRDYTASFGTIAFAKPGSYTYTVKETVPADTKGIVYDAQAGAGKTVTIKVKDNGDGTLAAEADSALVQTAEFTNTETGNGSIEVTKYTLKANGAFKVVNQTYYTALFSDAALTQRISEVKALVLRNTYTNSVTFTNLPYGTYYVGETNASGTPVTSGPNILSVVIEGGTITLSDANRTGSAVIKNTVPEGVLGAYADVSLKVQKNVVDASGRPLKVTDTFYFAVYTDAACTQRVRGVGVQSVKLSGSSGGSTSFRNLPYAATFYIAEVDKNGNKVASKTSFDYSVTVNGDGLTYRGAENATVTVTNKLKKGRVAAENRDTQEVKGAVRTGDNTPVLPMLATMIASGLAALYLVLARRKRRI